MALKRVTSEEARKVLGDAPPDSKWLFGDKVKESVQKIRDTSLITKAFQARANYGKYNYRLVGIVLWFISNIFYSSLFPGTWEEEEDAASPGSLTTTRGSVSEAG